MIKLKKDLKENYLNHTNFLRKLKMKYSAKKIGILQIQFN